MPAAVDFDLLQISTPFRMQPGLRRLQPGDGQLTPLAAGSALHEEKRRVVDAGQSRLVVPGFDPAPALAAIAERAAAEGVAFPAGGGIELAFEEDFAVLDGATGTLPFLCVCVPSHWAPEEKLGLDFTAVHVPVADNTTLLAAAGHLVRLATSGERWARNVWTITPSGRYDQHPRRHAREPWPAADDTEAFARACWLRAERQTFFPVRHGTRQSVFTIRVMLQPLLEAVDSPEKAQRLRDALASMTDAVLAYKGLAAARDPLLRWLEGRCA
ncbi:MAG TPA: heme-dependent oxidative N-demethylase subunit alpha family protein [Ramlibacter sp.]|nr:heme-dependent oxidative N-demethylase subunit alpha family protein [Ramlibacter sp.]